MTTSTAPVTANYTYIRGQTIKWLMTVERLTNDELPYNSLTNPYIPIDLTGSVIEMMWRTGINEPVTLSASSVTNDPIAGVPLFIITDAVNGEFKFICPPEVTEAFDISNESQDYEYDIQIIDLDDNITYPYKGTITMYKDYTR